MKNDFASRLKELRQEKGLSQMQLSKELGGQISAAAIGFWEKRTRVPNLDAVVLLANYFGVSIDYLAGVED